MIKTIFLLIGNIIFNALANVLMKVGMRWTDGVDFSKAANVIRSLVLNPALIIGVFSYAASLLFYIFALKKLDLSIAYPISVSSAMILVTIASSVILHESIAWNQVIGMAIIMFGIFVLTR